jgi:hypothetical protein
MTDESDSSAACSFCGRRSAAEDMVWARSGASICARCTASFADDLAHFGPPITTRTETRTIDAGEIRRCSRALGKRAGNGGCTHTYQATNGMRCCAYRHRKGERVILCARSPWLPPAWKFDES